MYVIIFQGVNTASDMMVVGPFGDAETAGDYAKDVYIERGTRWVVMPVLTTHESERILSR